MNKKWHLQVYDINMCLIETWKTRGQVVFSRVMEAQLESTQLAAHLSLQHVSKMGHFFRFFADCFDSHLPSYQKTTDRPSLRICKQKGCIRYIKEDNNYVDRNRRELYR